MVCVLDIGNSTIHCGKADEDGAIVSPLSCASDASVGTLASVHDYCIEGQIDAVVCASVKKPVSDALVTYFKEYSPAVPVRILTHQDFRADMPFDIPETTATGTDRCANAYALYCDKMFPAACVDFGTAITIEVLDTTGCFCGGAILPGIHFQSRALHSGTAALPELDFSEKMACVTGRTTNAALHAGILRGSFHALTGLLKEMSEELGASFSRIVLTGGYAHVYEDEFVSRGMPVTIDPYHTLRGIACAYYG